MTRPRVGINGFGRIGRAVFRINEKDPRFDIVAVNDINPDPENLVYLLKYDSTYGRLETKLRVVEDRIEGCRVPLRTFCEKRMANVPWADLDVDVVIDASGVHENVVSARSCLTGSVKKVIVTHSPDEVDRTLILGANEEIYDPETDHVVSASICDANALAPVLRRLNEAYGVKHGFVTTLHPWLSYQNLLDGPAKSQSYPGDIYHHYALGRASLPNLIPKPTTAVSATVRVLPWLEGLVHGFSYRTPTMTVTSANLTAELGKEVGREEVNDLFRKAARENGVFGFCEEPLVSMDYAGTSESVIVDGRWTEVVGDGFVRLVLWYDNEYGYSTRVCDLVPFVLGKKE